MRALYICSTWEPKPSVAIMMKKKIAHSWGTGIRDNASGYTTKAKPGPETAHTLVRQTHNTDGQENEDTIVNT